MSCHLSLLKLKFTVLTAVLFTTFLFGQPTLEATLDSIINNAIDSLAFPGAQLLVLHKDQTIIHKAYGHHTYERQIPVELHQVYDLASITKVSSGLPILMKLVDHDLIDLDKPISSYINDWGKSNKANLTIREILSHQAGLQPYIVFWAETLKSNGKFKRKTFRHKQSKRFPIRITDNLYMHRKYKSNMWKAIRDTELSLEKKYKYSGLLFLKLPELIEGIIKTDFETQLMHTFYTPLKATRLGYNPLSSIPLHDIVPTELDTFFRKTLVHGRVHDEAAAMLDGVSCNAGLFSNAESLAQLFRMYLNGGELNGKRYISEQAIKEFTSYQYPDNDNRRGLGFDKPPLEYIDGESYIAKSASLSSFGHSGFTGTFVWADPEYELLIIFLSNRVYPDRSQRKLYTMDIRPKLHQSLYDFLIH